MFEEVDYNDHKLVELSIDNVAKALAMIRNDSRYFRSMDKNAGPTYRKNGKIIYNGSTAYWMTQLKDYLNDDKKNCKKEFDKIIKGAVYAVDNENSTHLNSDHCGRKDVIRRICRYEKKEFLNCIKHPEDNNMKLFYDISKKTTAKRRARTNPSFASKFCHYACFYIF